MQNQEKTRFERRNRRKNLFKFENEKSTGYLETRHLLRKAVKHTPWLISASAAWLALFPCGLAFAADPNPPLTDTNTKYDIKSETAGATISGGRLSVTSIDTSKIWYVIANWAAAGNAIDGQTTLPDGATIGQSSGTNVRYAVGSYAPNGTANSSSVSATNATVYGDIIAGDGARGAIGNTVIATGTTITRSVIGGRSDNNQTENDLASNNRVILINSNVGWEVAGGFTTYGNAQSNTVTLTTGSTVTVYEGFFGGHTLNGVASGNIVEVLSASIVQGTYMTGGYARTGTANSNSVTVSGGSSIPLLYGGYASGDASSNIVILSGSTATASLYAGYANQGTANSNSVTGTDSSVAGSVYGGYTEW